MSVHARPLRAVFCSTYSWNTTVRVSAHHLARALARRGWEVLFLSTPVSPWHALARAGDTTLAEKFAAWRAGLGRAGEGLRLLTPMTLFPHSRRWPFGCALSLHTWQRWTIPDLRRELRESGFMAPDLLVVDNVLMGFLIEYLEAQRTVYRVTDYYPGFGSTTAAMDAAERELARRVDLVVYTARHLRAYVEMLAPAHAVCIENGVEVAFFAAGDPPLPPEYAHLPAPRALFVGTIDAWVDVDVLSEAARCLPEVAFVVIGPLRVPRQRFSAHSNLHLLGPRPYTALPGYLRHAQVGLIPFDRVRFPDLVDNINPLKLYEYLAAGLPVVAAEWGELQALQAPILTYRTGEECVRAVQHALQGHGPGLEARLAFAKAADWSARAGQLLDATGLAEKAPSCLRAAG